MESTVKTVIIDSVENSEGNPTEDKKKEMMVLKRTTLKNNKLLHVKSSISMSTRSFNTFRTDRSAKHNFTIEVSCLVNFHPYH